MTGLVALMVAGMVSERWNTRAMLLGSMWASIPSFKLE